MTIHVNEVRRFNIGGSKNQFRVLGITGNMALVFGDCCGAVGVNDVVASNTHQHGVAELEKETVLIQPIPDSAPELCAFPGCRDADFTPGYVHGPCAGVACTCNQKRDRPYCHDFVRPQPKALIAQPGDIHAGPPIVATVPAEAAKPVAKALPERRCSIFACARAPRNGSVYCGPCGAGEYKQPSAVASAPAVKREPWMPSVDDDHWIPDVRERSWRR